MIGVPPVTSSLSSNHGTVLTGLRQGQSRAGDAATLDSDCSSWEVIRWTPAFS